MKIILIAGGVLFALFATACTDREAEARRAKEDAAAKARAEAARKEMRALPQTFQTPDYFKRNKPIQKPAPITEPDKSSKQAAP